MSLKAILLAGGKGKRMRTTKAKVLHQLLGYPMIKYILRAVEDCGIKDIIIATGYQAEEVKKTAGEKYTFVLQEPQNGTAHALLCCKDILKDYDENLLVLPANIPLITPDTLRQLAQHHMTSGASCTILTGYCENPSGYNRVLRNKDGEILKIVKCQEIDEETKKITEINSGVYVFKSKDVFKALKDVKPDSRDNEYFLSDVVEILVKSGKKIESYQTTFTEEITSINSQIDLLNMAVYLKLQIINKHIEKGVTIIDPATTHIEPDVEIGKDTIINPFCVIRNYVKIGENCVVGPFAHLRAGTVLQDGARVGNFVEVKNTKVGKKSKAMHLAYLGDAILGKGVNIGAGTITANFDGIRKNTTVIEDDVFTGCNCVLIAPVKIGKGAVIGANAVVTKGKDVMPGDVVAGVPAKSIKSKSRRK